MYQVPRHWSDRSRGGPLRCGGSSDYNGLDLRHKSLAERDEANERSKSTKHIRSLSSVYMYLR
jgi:hypothetical protein